MITDAVMLQVLERKRYGTLRSLVGDDCIYEEMGWWYIMEWKRGWSLGDGHGLPAMGEDLKKSF